MFRSIPEVVNDLYLNFGDDLQLSPTGDLLLVSGSERSNQRIVRRLMTVPSTYIWHPNYGAGLPAYIGEALSVDNYDKIKTTITSQIFLEPTVSQVPQPKIYAQTIQYGLFAQIDYTMNPTQEPIVLTLNVES